MPQGFPQPNTFRMTMGRPPQASSMPPRRTMAPLMQRPAAMQMPDMRTDFFMREHQLARGQATVSDAMRMQAQSNALGSSAAAHAWPAAGATMGRAPMQPPTQSTPAMQMPDMHTDFFMPEHRLARSSTTMSDAMRMQAQSNALGTGPAEGGWPAADMRPSPTGRRSREEIERGVPRRNSAPL